MGRRPARISAVIVGALALVITAGCGSGAGNGSSAASGSGSVDIRFANTTPPDQIVGKASAEIVNALKGHGVDVKTFFNSSLYGQDDLEEAITRGDVDMAITPVDKWAGVEPALEYPDLPLIFPDVKSAQKALAGPLGDETSSLLAKHGNTVLGYFYYAFTNTYGTVDKVVHEPSDMQGLTMRSFSDIVSLTIKAYGATPVEIDPTEVYTALQRGTIDGVFSGASTFVTNKYDEQIKYAAVVPENLAIYVLSVNSDWWGGVPATEKRQIKDAVARASKTNADNLPKADDAALKSMQQAGVSIYRVPESDLGKWRAPTGVVYDHYRKISGPEGQKILDMIHRKQGASSGD